MKTVTPTQFKPGYGGNVYAGKDGNVYRPTSAGGWQQYNNASGAWKTPSGEGWGNLSAKGSGFNNTAASQQYRGFNNTSGGGGWNNAATRGSTQGQLNQASYARSAGYGGGGFGGYRGGGGFRGR